MKRYELILNLALLLIIGGLVYLIYGTEEQPRTLDELDVPGVMTTASGGRDRSEGRGTAGASGSENGEGEGDEDGEVGEDGIVRPPGRETDYGAEGSAALDDDEDEDDGGESDDDDDTDGADDDSTATVVASAEPEGQFGKRNIFRALLTPTPTPPPPTPTPTPTPNINQALGPWRLLSVYNGKALIEDVRLSAEEAEGAIWEMSLGSSKPVDVGNGIMKNATLKEISSDNPYNPEIIFSLEDTKAERKINLDTEPVVAAPDKKE